MSVRAAVVATKRKKKKARVQTDWAGFAGLVRYGCVFYLYLTVLKMFMMILWEYTIIISKEGLSLTEYYCQLKTNITREYL